MGYAVYHKAGQMVGGQTVAQAYRQIERLVKVHLFECSTHAHQYTISDGRLLFSDKLLEAYSPDKLAGPVGAEFVAVIDDIAWRQRSLKQYREAEASYQKALALHLKIRSFDEETSKKLSAGIYHQLGMVAQKQRQWPQAEQYYQHALQICIEHKDHYEQAGMYNNLGVVAEEQRQWQQARDCFLLALQIYAASNDTYRAGFVLRSLARLWQTSGDTSLPTTIASAFDMPPAEVETLLREMLGNEAEGEQTE